MARLRSADGCPWDRKQDHRSLKPYLIEECHEVLEAIDRDDCRSVAEELGDVLLQIAFHAQIGSESGRFDMDTILDAITGKLIRRHPHVFGTESVETPEQVVRNWNRIKSDEKPKPDGSSFLDSVPRSLPQLMAARKLQDRAGEAGFDWETIQPVREKVMEEWNELLREIDSDADPGRIEAEFGDVLFALVNLSRFLKINPEEALRASSRKFRDRFRGIEKRTGGADAMKRMDLEDLDAIWNDIKGQETD
ncbi:nucleoside triphosphate pyrophosphohydrolase [bacterium]|nr:nucleoside triphosphate pyrophosphohydrolase [candidate division CSSED10-310 bacterium]